MSGRVPTAEECFQLIEQYGMLDNIREHSVVVARVARLLTRALQKTGANLSLEVVVAGGLLHDIGKTACLDNDDNHALMGSEICLRHQLPTIAAIVGEHVWLQDIEPAGRYSEKEIVYYADKRVNHDRVVDLEERLAYILGRYAANDEQLRRRIHINFLRCQQVETKIFSQLDFSPDKVGMLLEDEDPQLY